MRDLLWMGGFVLACVVFAFGIAIAIAYWWGLSVCDAQWVDFDHRYGLFSGCMVEYGGTWYPDEVVRSVIEP